jgi:hypothetical protein
LPNLKSHSFGRSIECEFDHLFLVETPLTIGDALAESQIAKELLARGRAHWAWARLARRKYQSRLTSGCYGILNGRSIECEFDHLFLVETALDHRGRACQIELKASAVVHVGMRLGNWMACAQKISEPTHVRLLRGILNGRSIECEFDHLFLVETPLTIGDALARSN